MFNKHIKQTIQKNSNQELFIQLIEHKLQSNQIKKIHVNFNRFNGYCNKNFQIEEIGSGTFGQVFRSIDNKYAIKRIVIKGKKNGFE